MHRTLLSLAAGMALATLFVWLLGLFAESMPRDEFARSQEPAVGDEFIDPREPTVATPDLDHRFAATGRTNRSHELVVRLAEEPAEAFDMTWLHEELAEAYRDKLRNHRYVEWKNLSGIPRGYQDYYEEARIKEARSQIARAVAPPAGTRVIEIPNVPSERPVLDGRFDPLEYWRAVEVVAPLDGRDDVGTRLYLLSDGEHLHLACDVPAERTASGYDQFRFYFHVGTTPLIVNERIHVGRSTRDAVLGGHRQTLVPWSGDPPENEDQRWKKYDISDWRIFQAARGLSTMADAGHRQYEVRLELHEAGLHVGVPFPSFVEVETDPEMRDGKFVQRRYLGHLGSQDEPVWFVIRD